MEEQVGTEPAEVKVETPQQEVEAPKYTDKQMNDIVAKNSAKEAARILKEAGIETTGNLKDDVAKFKAWKEAQMSEAEKYKAQLAEREKLDEEKAKKYEEIEARSEAVDRGVPKDKAEKVARLAMSGAYEGATMAERVASVLADLPEFIKAPVKDIGAKTEGQIMNAGESAKQQALRELGIKR